MDCLRIAEVIAESLAAVGTVAAFFAAIATIKESQRQFDEERKEQHKLQDQKQASNVAVWAEERVFPSIPTPFDTKKYVQQKFIIENANQIPIYNVIVSAVQMHGANSCERGEDSDPSYPCRLLFREIPSGTWAQILPTNGSGMHTSIGLEIAFSDSAGLNWVRRGNGALERIPSNPLEYYDIEMPCDWAKLHRLES